MNRLNKTIHMVREKNPLIHHITNIVTMNDCANITLAIGASPIMAMDPKEVEEVTSESEALVMNMGTLNERVLEAMIMAGKVANQLNIPIVLDPTGIGISAFRKQGSSRILEGVKIDIIKGNASEVKTLLGLSTCFRGVDSLDVDNIESLSEIVLQVSRKLKVVAVCTGETDIIACNKDVHLIKGGHPMLKNITGTGCMIGSLMGSYLGVNRNKIEAAELAVESMNIAGERAYAKMVREKRGSGSYRVFLIDEISRLADATGLEKY